MTVRKPRKPSLKARMTCVNCGTQMFRSHASYSVTVCLSCGMRYVWPTKDSK